MAVDWGTVRTWVKITGGGHGGVWGSAFVRRGRVVEDRATV